MATCRTVDGYDPATNKWSILPSLPVSRHGLAAGVIGNRLDVIGGDVQSTGTEVHVSTESHDAYEFSTGGNWSEEPVVRLQGLTFQALNRRRSIQ